MAGALSRKRKMVRATQPGVKVSSAPKLPGSNLREDCSLHGISFLWAFLVYHRLC